MWNRARCDHLPGSLRRPPRERMWRWSITRQSDWEVALQISFEMRLGIPTFMYVLHLSSIYFFLNTSFIYARLRNNSEPSSWCEMTLFLNNPLSWASMTGVFGCMLLAKCRLLLNSCTVTSSSLDVTSLSSVLTTDSRDFSGQHNK